MSRRYHVEGVISAAEMIRQDIFPFLDKEKVYIAAKNHDILKDIDPKSAVEEYSLPPDMLLSPAVIHAFAGGEYLLRLGLSGDIADAVRYHTTGRPNMTDIEKIIFVADYIEENREYETCKNARNIYLQSEKTKENFDKLILKILKDTIGHLEKKKAEIYPLTLDTMKWYERRAVEDACPYGL